MSIIAIRQSNRHRPAPIQEGVAWLCKNAISRAPPRREIANTRFDTGCLCHLNDVIVRPNATEGRHLTTLNKSGSWGRLKKIDTIEAAW